MFDLYFAGSSTPETEAYIKEHGLCRLQSQFNDRTNIKRYIEADFKGKLFIDSGAYTAYTRQVELDVDEYISYINANIDNFTIFAQVDKIPGKHGHEKTIQDIKEAPELSWANYLYMRERITQPNKLLPIFHRREDWKYLEQMLETTFNGKHIPYIGLAATTDSSVKEKEDWFEKCFEIIRKSSNPNVKTHAFGMTSLKLLELYPFTSADSTSWIMTAINGGIMTPYGVVVVSERKKDTEKNHIMNRRDCSQEVLEQHLGKYGLTVQQVSEDVKYRLINNLCYLQEWCNNYKYKGNHIYKKRLF